MTTPLDDEKIAAYVLGELDGIEREVVEAVLEGDTEMQRTVVGFRNVAQVLTEALAVANAPELSAAQRTAVLEDARETANEGKGRQKLRRDDRDRRYARRGVRLAFIGAVTLVLCVPALLLFDRISNLSQRDEMAAQLQAMNAELSKYRKEPRPAEHGWGYGGGGGFGGAMGGYGGNMAYFAPPTANLGRAAGQEYADDVREKMSALGYLDKDGDGVPNVYAQLGENFADVPNQTAAGVSAQPATPQGTAEEPIPDETAPQPYLIRTGMLFLECEDVRQSISQLTGMVTAANGYVSDLRESVDGLGRRSATIQVRVPADKLDGALQGIEALGRVVQRQVSTQDVSEEYVDTDARIRNLQKTEERLLDHLGKALLIESTLKIEQELTRVREQLERLEGRLRYLKNRIHFSTITVTIGETPKPLPVVPVESFSSGNVASAAIRSLIEFGRSLWARAIWIGVWSPVWLPCLLITALAIRFALRRIKRWFA